MSKKNFLAFLPLRKHHRIEVRLQDIESERLNILRWSHERGGGVANVVYKTGERRSYRLPEFSEHVLDLFKSGMIIIESYTSK